MKVLGTPREVDSLGRITIPKELRIRFGLEPGTKVEIIATSEGILLRSYVEPNPIMEQLHRLNTEINNRDFPIHTKRVKNNSFKVVYLEEFWIWAEKNKDFLNFSGFEPLALGVEPEWVAEKRRNDYQMKRRIKKTPWEPAEDDRLIRLVKQQKYGFMELSGVLNRTEGAIQIRLIDLGIKDRPVKADNTVKWTDDEFRILGDMITAGKRYEQMSEAISNI